MDAGRQAHRPDPPARGVWQHLLRRPQAQPPVHGREPVALRGVYRHPRRRTGLTGSATSRYSEGGVGVTRRRLFVTACQRDPERNHQSDQLTATEVIGRSRLVYCCVNTLAGDPSWSWMTFLRIVIPLYLFV